MASCRIPFPHKVRALTRARAEIDSLQSTLSQLTAANTTLDAEVTDLMRRVASGEYNPATERLVEFANNPAARIRLVRQKELDELREENNVLLNELGALEDAKGEEGGGKEASGKYVPRESWERLVKEKEALEAGHAKRLQRLKEVSDKDRPGAVNHCSFVSEKCSSALVPHLRALSLRSLARIAHAPAPDL